MHLGTRLGPLHLCLHVLLLSEHRLHVPVVHEPREPIQEGITQLSPLLLSPYTITTVPAAASALLGHCCSLVPRPAIIRHIYGRIRTFRVSIYVLFTYNLVFLQPDSLLVTVWLHKD